MDFTSMTKRCNEMELRLISPSAHNSDGQTELLRALLSFIPIESNERSKSPVFILIGTDGPNFRPLPPAGAEAESKIIDNDLGAKSHTLLNIPLSVMARLESTRSFYVPDLDSFWAGAFAGLFDHDSSLEVEEEKVDAEEKGEAQLEFVVVNLIGSHIFCHENLNNDTSFMFTANGLLHSMHTVIEHLVLSKNAGTVRKVYLLEQESVYESDLPIQLRQTRSRRGLRNRDTKPSEKSPLIAVADLIQQFVQLKNTL
ncbi:uncharacterized protein V1516DRAFT_128847 [Lipomyces oligophaga]|uniref:uncharacterized protein n=1 Tax=Lipomyces oligophaga TaxID=45792 RepID=UPI0034CE33E2